MDGKSDEEKLDEVILPGFRFHPTDEELVGFYLKRKIQQWPLSIELIKQLDIYKYDPWDLPKFAATGEKEWYFYCPRDRKYRNSARPNRVTGAGFWKATGTDRPIYSSEGSKCIGLKKSLVFYKGRAAKGTKTDWMMHEFRLPSLMDDSIPSKRCIDKTLPANDSWAICRIFKKTSSVSHRVVSHSWVSPLPSRPNAPHTINPNGHNGNFRPESLSSTSETSSLVQPDCTNTNDMMTQLPFLGLPFYKPHYPATDKSPELPISSAGGLNPAAYWLPPLELPEAAECSAGDVSSMLFNMSSSVLDYLGNNTSENIDFGGQNTQCNSLSMALPLEKMQAGKADNGGGDSFMMRSGVANEDEDQLGRAVGSMGFPAFNLPLDIPEEWKSSLMWDCLPCPSEVFTNKCYS
ncbi:hypothetical protein Nepgr_017146 [Nepenthes gracilis]|uniref:NAC domain-containing protein n=1 Tax=Nepenthes gracilis TaxID=150966 RepID=A0AAD3SNY3_NEPGR|nr:hypothetical protein Nepgr_017146 [Nepenthes gracilis]